MSTWYLVLREIGHRKLNFALGVLSVVIASAVLVAELGLLARHDANTAHLLARKQQQLQAELDVYRDAARQEAAAYDEEMRKITKGLGFNILILPKDQDLTHFYSEGYADKLMPEDYVHRLAAEPIVTVRHLLPILERKVDWPEQGRKIVLVGTRGEVPFLHKAPKQAIQDPVRPGEAILGHELARVTGLEPNDTLSFRGRDFRVREVYPERGSKDDITLWMNLAEAQEMLELEGKINAIMALECKCAWADLDRVQAELGKVLPDTQIKELGQKALARARARREAALRGERRLEQARAHAKEVLAGERAARADLRGAIEGLAAIVVPLAVGGAVAWVALLTYTNVRQRRAEVGILRAIGVGSRKLLGVFVARASAVGLVGVVLGVAAGLAVARWTGEKASADVEAGAGWLPIVGVVLASPVLCALAGWVPATLAGRQDPAVVLSEE
jgi:hypothetical protein